MPRIPAFAAIAALCLCAPAPGAAAPRAAARPLPHCSIGLAEDIVFEVDPRIELLAGVQSQTPWTSGDRGPGEEGSRYFDELRAFFAPSAGSAAVERCRRLAGRGFAYDAPCAFALSLEGGAALRPPAEGWTADLAGRAGGARDLDRLASSLAELYAESGFEAFLAAHEPEYRRWLSEASRGFEARAVSDWLRSFYGPVGNPVYHFVLAPAMFPGGGYGFSRETGEGPARRLHVYQIVRAPGSPDGGPGFPSGRELALLALHEFGHSYVNPALEAGSKDRRLAAVFEPVEARMRKMAYGQAGVFLNELVIRAACVVAGRELGLYTPLEAEMELRREEELGFYPIRRVAGHLGRYAGERQRYRGFADFALELLEALASEAPAIVEEGGRGGFAGRPGDGPAPAASFAESFDGALGELGIPPGFEIGLGAQTPGGAGATRLAVESAAGESASLGLAADAGTGRWYILEKPIAVEEGLLSLRYRASGEGIRREGGQFGGSYVGFILTDRGGGRRFAVRMHSGSFPWSDFALEERVDASKVASIRFAVFLNESGLLRVDDIEVGYRK